MPYFKQKFLVCIVVLVTTYLPLYVYATETVGGGGHSAENLILDWARSKSNKGENLIKFSDSILSSDLGMLKKKKIDFAIVDSPISEPELEKMGLMQVPFALSGISIVVNLPSNVDGALKLDGTTLGKIFSGEITKWNDPTIQSLNPKHDFPNKEIVIIHSGDLSNDYQVLNSYLNKINDKWRSFDFRARERMWPLNSVFKAGLADRYAAIKNTPYSISFTPMLYSKHPYLSKIKVKNIDGNYVGISDKTIAASAANINVEDSSVENLSLIDKKGSYSWPVSNFLFVVVNKESINDEKIIQLFSIISFGLKFGSLKPMLYDYVTIPDQTAKTIVSKIDAISDLGKKMIGVTSKQQKVKTDFAEVQLPNKKTGLITVASAKLNVPPDEVSSENKLKQQPEAKPVRVYKLKQANNTQPVKVIVRPNEESRANKLKHQVEARDAELELSRQKEKNRVEELAKARAAQILSAKLAIDEEAKKIKATKIATEENARKREEAEKQKELELRHQKDEDPIDAYRRSLENGGGGR